MNKKSFTISILLAILLSFNFVEASNKNHQTSKDPCTIEQFIAGSKLYFEFILADGLEIPDTYEIQTTKDTLICYFRAKVIDGYLFPDSEGHPLSNFDIIFHAYNKPKDNLLAIEIITTVEVVRKSQFLEQTMRTEFTYQIDFEGIQFHENSKLQLTKSPNTPQLGQISFNFIFND